MNPKHVLNLYFTGELDPVARVRRVVRAAAAVVVRTHAGGGADDDRPVVVGPRDRRPDDLPGDHLAGFVVRLFLTNELLVSFATSIARAARPDGTRRNPLWSPDARLFLTVTCRLDAFYGRVTRRSFAS